MQLVKKRQYKYTLYHIQEEEEVNILVLYTFGTGPIKGFATTLIIGIVTSLFAAIFITRLIISARLKKDKNISFATKLTDGAFKNINIDFVGNRKKFYAISSILVIVGLGSLFTKGLNYGVDFAGPHAVIHHQCHQMVDLLMQCCRRSTCGLNPHALPHAPSNHR